MGRRVLILAILLTVSACTSLSNTTDTKPTRVGDLRILASILAAVQVRSDTSVVLMRREAANARDILRRKTPIFAESKTGRTVLGTLEHGTASAASLVWADASDILVVSWASPAGLSDRGVLIDLSLADGGAPVVKMGAKITETNEWCKGCWTSPLDGCVCSAAASQFEPTTLDLREIVQLRVNERFTLELLRDNIAADLLHEGCQPDELQASMRKHRMD